MIARSTFFTLALGLPLAALAQKEPLLDRIRSASKVLDTAQKAEENKRYREAGEAWKKLATEFYDTRLLPEWAVYDSAFFAAEAFAQAGDADSAFSWLEQAVQRWPWHNNLEKRESLLSLHKDPRWRPFLTRWNRAQQRDLTSTEKIYGLTRFWQEAKENFAFFDRVPDLDWDAAYQTYLPIVLAAKGRYEYFRALERFCALLNDGHTNVYAPNDLNPWGLLPFRFTPFENRICVTNVTRALQAELPLGTEVLKINGLPAAEYVQKTCLPSIASSTSHIRWRDAVRHLSYERQGDRVTLTLRTPKGQEVTRRFTYDPALFNAAWSVSSGSIPNFAQKELGEGIFLITLGSFGSSEAADAFEKALPQLQKTAKGVIFDIRRNGGGNSGVGWRIARHLTDTPLLTSAWRTRERRSAYRAWGMFARVDGSQGSAADERIRHFLGDAWYSEPGESLAPAPESERLRVPVVVLTDYDTASAAEDFLIVLDSARHVTRVGRKTYGSTGQPIPLLLPGAIQARVCTKRDTFPDGRDFVGVGVVPHIEVAQTPQDYLAQRDVILERGLAVRKEKISTGL